MHAAALELAAAHPYARLPCPVCANTVNARNLAAHLAKVHGDVPPHDGRGKRWGFLPARLDVGAEAVSLSTLLRTRRVALPCTVEVGALVGTRVPAGMSAYDDVNEPGEAIRTGWYLRLGGSIVVGCAASANLKHHWSGWTQGPRRRRAHARFARPILVELEYALATSGALTPRTLTT